MKRTPLKRKSATKRRTTSPRCERQRCNKRAEIEGLCVSHAEQRADDLMSLWVRARDHFCMANFEHECSGRFQAAHIIGRRNQAVRYDPRNVWSLCDKAHPKVDQHTAFGIKVDWALSLLGEDGFAALREDARVMTDRRQAIEAALGWLAPLEAVS